MHRDEGLIRKIAGRCCMLFSNWPFLNVSWIVIKASGNTSWFRHNFPKRSGKVIGPTRRVLHRFHLWNRRFVFPATQTFLDSRHNPTALARTPVDQSQTSGCMICAIVCLVATFRLFCTPVCFHSGDLFFAVFWLKRKPNYLTWFHVILLLNVPYLYLTN